MINGARNERIEKNENTNNLHKRYSKISHANSKTNFSCCTFSKVENELLSHERGHKKLETFYLH